MASSVCSNKRTRVYGAGAVGTGVRVRGLWFLEDVAFSGYLPCGSYTMGESYRMTTSLWQIQSQSGNPGRHHRLFSNGENALSREGLLGARRKLEGLPVSRDWNTQRSPGNPSSYPPVISSGFRYFGRYQLFCAHREGSN